MKSEKYLPPLRGIIDNYSPPGGGGGVGNPRPVTDRTVL